MKHTILLLVSTLMAMGVAMAQKPVYESATQTFGYKNAEYDKLYAQLVDELATSTGASGNGPPSKSTATGATSTRTET